MNKTMIQVDKKVVERLKKIKIVARETYNEVLIRLLDSQGDRTILRSKK